MNKEEIHDVVEEAVRETFIHLGVDLNNAGDVRELQSDLAYIRRARRGSEEVARWTKRGLIGAGVSGLLYLLVEGIRQSFTRGP